MSEKDLSIEINVELFEKLFADITDREGNSVVNGELPKKQNPHTIIQEEKKKPDAYRSVRLFSDDYEFYRQFAHERKINILDAVHMSRRMLEEYDRLYKLSQNNEV